MLHYLKESDKEYRIRALTRDASKPKAKALADLGAEVISIDLKPENKDDIVKAYKGADAVFVGSALLFCDKETHKFLKAVTNFWEHVDKERVRELAAF